MGYFKFLIGEIRKSLDRWKDIKARNTRAIGGKVLDALKEYKWNVINEYQGPIPGTVIERNRSWVRVILENLSSNHENNLLVVVGNGHLTKPGVNFVHFLKLSLMDRLKKIERFNPNQGTDGEWKEVEILG